MNFIALDFETANSKRQSICSIGLSIIEKGQIVHTVNQLIKPTPNYFDGINIGVHGIKPEMVENAPTFEQLWPDIFPLLDNANVVAHNASFDFSALRYALDAYNIPYPSLNYFCTLGFSKNLYPELDNHKLPTVCKHLNISGLNHHDAESDALACSKIMLHILNSHNATGFDDLATKISFTQGELFPTSYKAFSCKSNCSKRKPSEKKHRLKGDILKPDFENAINQDNIFFMKKVVISGFSSAEKRDIAILLKMLGADIDTSVSKKTNFLIAGSNVGPKKTQVMNANIMEGRDAKIIDSLELYELVKDYL
jgi:DNA polymerase-3 subunit epsilon